ncbi:MAG: glycosyltransferase [Candidatus Omnitrophica bacterium]|nr:glycosyltransferase [Candidatus Omnitrophota bacterium]
MLFVSRPVSPPWDEASKNLVRDMISFGEGYEFHFLTDRSDGVESEGARGRKIYSSGKLDLVQKARLFRFLLKERAAFDLYHFCFTPEPATSVIIRAVAPKGKTVQSIPYISGRAKSVKRLVFADAVIVNSLHSRRVLEEEGLDNARVIYPGVDVDRFAPPAGERKPPDLPFRFNILWAGDIASEEVIKNLTETIKKVAGTDAAAGFVIAVRDREKGDASRNMEFRKVLEEEGLTDRVFFTGTVEDMPSLMASVDMFIYPFAEGFRKKIDIPLVIIEAMSSGLPVAVTDAVPLNEVFRGGAGLRVHGSSPECMARAVKSLLEDEDLRRETGKRNREAAVKYFNVKNNVAEYGSVYGELLN